MVLSIALGILLGSIFVEVLPSVVSYLIAIGALLFNWLENFITTLKNIKPLGWALIIFIMLFLSGFWNNL